MKLIQGEREWDASVKVSGSGAAAEVTVGERKHAVTLEDVAPGTWIVRDGTHATPLHCVRSGDTIHFFWKGAAYTIAEEREGGRTAHRHAAGGLEAPMPGKVIKISLAPGQAVVKGQEILVIEAMKMENAIRAPRDGVIKSISAEVGQMVAPGVVLVELE